MTPTQDVKIPRVGALQVSLVALPLGNVRDLSERMRSSLEEADLIFCEDSRKITELCRRASIELRARLKAIPGDTEKDYNWADELRTLGGEAKVVMLSDAGTPLVCDPGLSLLRFCQKNNIACEAVPGPSAPILAWQWSGGFGLPFVFGGFAPKVTSSENKKIREFFDAAEGAGTYVFFDSKHQVSVTLAHLKGRGWGEKKLHLARDMTKPHEELVLGTVTSVSEDLMRRIESSAPLGELTFILEGSKISKSSTQAPSIDMLLRLRSQGPKQAAKEMAALCGQSVEECYKALVEDSKKNRSRVE